MDGQASAGNATTTMYLPSAFRFPRRLRTTFALRVLAVCSLAAWLFGGRVWMVSQRQQGDMFRQRQKQRFANITD